MEVVVGKRVRKEKGIAKAISGTVKSYNSSLGFFEIVYEDGASEEMDFEKLSSILLDGCDDPVLNQILPTSRPNKQPPSHTPPTPSSGNNLISTQCLETLENDCRGLLDLNSMPVFVPENENDTCFDDGIHENFNKITPEDEKRKKHCFDVNVSVVEEEEVERGTHVKEEGFVAKQDFTKSTPQEQRCFDVNVSVDEEENPPPEVKVSNEDINMGVTTGCYCVNEGMDVEDRDLGGRSLAYIVKNEDGGGVSPVVQHKQEQEQENGGHSGRRKRRRVLDDLNATPRRVLRRSTRRLSSTPNGNTAVEVDLVSDNTYSVLSYDTLPPKVELPPSSMDLSVDEVPVLDLLSVYSFLRSFTTLLFLSPFELEAFVQALQYKFPNTLIDSVHYSLLQTLKGHLEFLSDEGSQAASNCLRSLNWAFLDEVTWPVYLVEYLLTRASGLKPAFECSHLKLLINDYYKQSTTLKLEILQCLCDDIMEAETIRAELNRRTLASELDIDADRIAHTEISKKRKDLMDEGGGSCLTQDADVTTDGNSDDCCLCKMDGSLICCDGCPAAYHTRCVGITKDQLPEGEWYCPECQLNRCDGGAKFQKPLRGAEVLGVDPYGRLYFSCCGYLLVLNSKSDPESSYYYYNMNDLKVVIEILKSSNILYGGILRAISKNWNIPVESTSAQDHQNSQIGTIGKVLELDSQVSLPETVKVNTDVKGYETLSVTKDVVMETLNPLIPAQIPVEQYEQPAETSQDVEGSQAHQTTGVDYCNGYTGTVNKSETLEETHSTCAECSLKPTNFDLKQNIGASGRTSVVINSGKGLDFDPGYYVNYYGFARTAASVANELMNKSPDSIKEDMNRSSEEIISAQTKAICKNAASFGWLNVHKLHQNDQNENCGWCFSCRTSTESRDCLFNTTFMVRTSEGSKSASVGLRSKRVRKSHLYAIISHILSIEERLSGLLLGPWKNPNYSKSWHKSLLNATDVTLVKRRLLTLESNLRRLALSAEWLKQVDTLTTGSASHVMTTSVQVSSSKQGGSRKRARISVSDADPNSDLIAAARSGIFWWRGGRVSRLLFNCKVLPHSLALKGARQAGWKKIAGIFYPEGLEFAKRSKYIAWRAAVETSTSLAHLACQVRELDSNIRWDDLENTQGFSHLSKESRKEMKLFKKVTIRRKCIEGSNVKYLLDFGKRKAIPNTVTRNGVMLEASASERKKYWLDESFVPLHILKGYEEKKLARVSDKVKPGSVDEGEKILKRSSRKRGLLNLLSKEEKFDYCQCGHCKKDVLIRDAVTCHSCKAFFHRRHARKSENASAAECTYTCHRCQDQKFTKKSVKPKPKKKNTQSQKSKKTFTEGRPRRSLRKVSYAAVKSKKLGKAKKSKKVQPKKGQSKKSKKGICWHKGRRTHVYHAYWLNGLRLTRKPNDARVVHFTEGKLFLPQSSSNTVQPTCSICCEAGHKSALTYVNCEKCQEWFHGEAVGLTPENSSIILGFQCHSCRKRNPPTCPYLEDKRISLITG